MKVTRTDDGHSVRLRYGADRRGSFLIRTHDEARAAVVAEAMSDMARRLIRAGQSEIAKGILERAGLNPDDETLEQQRRLVEFAEQGRLKPKDARPRSTKKTFREVAEWWTSGGAARDFPHNRLDMKPDWAASCRQLERSVYSVPVEGGTFGSKPIAEITRADCDEIMRRLPIPKGKMRLSPSTSRQYALLLSRVFNLAELAGWIARTPLPRSWAPSPGPRKRFPILYPGEDRQLMACTEIPLCRRIFYGFLHREGSRRGEAAGLQAYELDLTHGTVALDENKTDHPRWWKLCQGVAVAIDAWFEIRGGVERDAFVFVDDDGSPLRLDHMATMLRDDLRRAGLEREDLYTRGPNKEHFGTHCFRRSMVTRNLSLGVDDDWVRQRTGHTRTRSISTGNRRGPSPSSN